MRVIGGQNRGVKLHTADEKALRPMLDRVKESLFNIMQGNIEGSAVLDLFSGSGALGIEAISRGASRCLFVEQNRRLSGLIRRNLEVCGIGCEKARVINQDVYKLPETDAGSVSYSASLVFVDPPYAMISDNRSREELFTLLGQLAPGWISADAVVVLHHAPMPFALWPQGVLHCYDRRVYGRSQLSFFEVNMD